METLNNIARSLNTMFLLLLLISALINARTQWTPGLSGDLWCGSTQTWNKRFSTVELMDMNNETISQYRHGSGSGVIFSLTASIGALIGPTDKFQNVQKIPGEVYGQLYIKQNGRVFPPSYLLVKEGQVNHVEGNIDLSSGDVLELFTGHITLEKSYVKNGRWNIKIPGISVEDIT